MTDDKLIMDDPGPFVVVVVCSVGALIGIVLGVMLCSWCFGNKKDDNDDKKDVLSRKYKPVAATESETGQGDIRTLNKRSWEDKGISKKSPVISGNTIKLINLIKSGFERPERRVVTEHVQPSPSSPAALNDTLGMRRDPYPAYQTMASPQKLPSQGSRQNSEDENSSVWKGMRSIATRLMEDVEETKTDTATAITVDGIDYNLGKIQLALIKKKNLNPRWNECFLFEGWPHNKLLEKTIYLQVIDYDRFSRDDPIGETYIPLNEMDLSQSPVVWKYLAPCKDSRGKLGELLLSLSYQPNVGRLSVIVMKAKDLKIKDITGSSDPYVKLWLMYGASKVEKKKTSKTAVQLN
ncbi:hypothetical protein ScPMuIL_013291 [Solemya velum]